MNTTAITFTHPDVLTRGVTEGWADPQTDPARIDWTQRLKSAAIPFAVVDGRPLNPFAPTGIRYGRNELGHWGEQLCADAIVTADTPEGRHLLMVERGDGHGWALPGGTVDPGEEPLQAAVRELAEETRLVLHADAGWRVLPARYVPDPRASDEAWMVTVPCRIHLGPMRHRHLPVVEGDDDASRAAWVHADDHATLTAHLTRHYGTCGRVFSAHQQLLAEVLA